MQKPLITCENLVKIYHEHTPATSAIIGLPSETHHESILIDRVGRLQLPKEAIDSIPLLLPSSPSSIVQQRGNTSRILPTTRQVQTLVRTFFRLEALPRSPR